MPVGLDYLDPFLVWHDEFAYLMAPEEKEGEEPWEEEKEEETLRFLALWLVLVEQCLHFLTVHRVLQCGTHLDGGPGCGMDQYMEWPARHEIRRVEQKHETTFEALLGD